MLDMLRSCYSTLAVLEEGRAPVQIDWWFVDPNLPPAPRHQWGSLNWQRGRVPAGQLGEVVGAPRPWRDGSKPAGACGDQVTAPCHQTQLPPTLYFTISHPGSTFSFPITSTTEPTRWSGQGDGEAGACGRFIVVAYCLSGQGVNGSQFVVNLQAITTDFNESNNQTWYFDDIASPPGRICGAHASFAAGLCLADQAAALDWSISTEVPGRLQLPLAVQ